MTARKLNKQELTPDVANSNDNLTSSISQVEGAVNPLWGGFFNNSTNELTRKMLSSLNIDKRLYAVAIESTKAQLRMHVKREIIADQDGKKLIEGLDIIKKEISEGKFNFDNTQNDIYDNIERRLAELCGGAVESLYIARSKNDQISGDLKLWVRDAYDSLDSGLLNLQAALIDKAEENVKTLMPGYTNMQVEQPISLGHHLMAYVEMLGRDRGRIKDARARLNTSPYGSNSLAGSAFYINREMVGRILGFDKAAPNSIDSVTDRDYVVEFLSFASICSMHLSRIAEDLIFWHSPNNNFISFSNAFVVQSSITPFKRDPKIIELVRGRTGKVYGALVNILTTLKGLSVGFSEDLQEAAEPVFETYDTLLNNINVMAALSADFIVNRKEMKEAAQYGYSTAPDLVNWLIINTGMQPKKAINTTQKIVNLAIQKESKLSLLELNELQAIEPKINDDIYSVLIASRAVISRRTTAGTNPVQVRKAIRSARRRYL
ncbi:argininosuccinate lyase [Holosporaceae bacterium 'Namur']|nr:argininosuccinate lyase [Holosporaceae bacterium 'Namur']